VFRRLGSMGFQHEYVNAYQTDDPDTVMPGVHLVSSLLTRWLTGTLHYAASAEHLDYYLDEFTFRCNRRKSAKRGLLFYRLLQQAVDADPHPLKDLIGGGRPARLHLSRYAGHTFGHRQPALVPPTCGRPARTAGDPSEYP